MRVLSGIMGAMSKNDRGEFAPADPKMGQDPVGPPPVAHRELSPVELAESLAEKKDRES